MTTRNPTFDNITLGGKGNDSMIRSLDIAKDLYINSLGNLKFGCNGTLVVENSALYDGSGGDLAVGTASYCAHFINARKNEVKHGIKITAGKASDSNPETVYLLAQDGNGTAIGALRHETGGNFSVNATSDERLKKNIRDTKYQGLNIINKLKVRDYEWKKNDLTNTSFIAQELLKVYPKAVSGDVSDYEEETKTGNPLMVANSELIPILVKSIQELSNEVKELKKKLHPDCSQG